MNPHSAARPEDESDPSLPAYLLGPLVWGGGRQIRKPPGESGELGYLLYPQGGLQPWHLWAACGRRSAVSGHGRAMSVWS